MNDIVNAVERKPIISLHGLGFLQVQIPGGIRFHAWHPDLPKRKCFIFSQIHNHRWSFNSTILAGSLANILHDVVDDPNGTHIRYSHDSNRGWRPDGHVRVSPRPKPKIYHMGNSYHMPHAVYHSSQPMTATVLTMIDKVYTDNSYAACSLCMEGIEPETDFDQFQLSEDRMWKIFHDVLARG